MNLTKLAKLNDRSREQRRCRRAPSHRYERHISGILGLTGAWPVSLDLLHGLTGRSMDQRTPPSVETAAEEHKGMHRAVIYSMFVVEQKGRAQKDRRGLLMPPANVEGLSQMLSWV